MDGPDVSIKNEKKIPSRGCGHVSGLFVLRYQGLTFLMLTIAVSQILQNLASKLRQWTGGDDGLSGFSIGKILGLASFGEGLDLPGDLCSELWITKLPFGSPDDPVGEARAEFVEASGGNAFADLVVPETGVRLLQWTGRGIRTETDTARITIFDRRITEQAYGRRILAGLPSYPVEVVKPD